MKFICVDGPVAGQWHSVSDSQYGFHVPVYNGPRRCRLDMPSSLEYKIVNYRFQSLTCPMGRWFYATSNYFAVSGEACANSIMQNYGRDLVWKLHMHMKPDFLTCFNVWLKWTMVCLDTPFDFYVKAQKAEFEDRLQDIGAIESVDGWLPVWVKESVQRAGQNIIPRELAEDCILPSRYSNRLHS